jgi:hypothetical protein
MGMVYVERHLDIFGCSSFIVLIHKKQNLGSNSHMGLFVSLDYLLLHFMPVKSLPLEFPYPWSISLTYIYAGLLLQALGQMFTLFHGNPLWVWIQELEVSDKLNDRKNWIIDNKQCLAKSHPFCSWHRTDLMGHLDCGPFAIGKIKLWICFFRIWITGTKLSKIYMKHLDAWFFW